MTLGETTKRTNDKRCNEGKYKGITHTLPEIQELSNRQLIYGLRWHCADSKHDICIQAAGNQHREFDCISHKLNQINQWAQSLHERIGDVIAAALELSKGPLVYALQKYDCFVIFPVNPSTLAKYREAFTPSRPKDDRTDAELA